MICLISCIAFSSVQSASFYLRNGREVLIPVENELVREEIVSELKKELEPIAAEEPMPVVDAIVREEVVVPVETLRIAEPVVAVEEPVAISDTEIVVPVVSALRNAAPEVVGVPEAVFVPLAAAEKEKIPEIRSTEVVAEIKKEDAAEVKPSEEKEATIAVKAIETDAAEEAVIPEVSDVVVPVVDSEEMSVRQSEGTPARPTLIQAAQNTLTNLISNTPIATAIQAIRGDEEIPQVVAADAAAPEAAAGSAATTPVVSSTHRPNLYQQLQHNVQNLQHQIQSALTGGAAPAQNAGGENRPPGGIISQLQHTIGQAFTRPIGAIFRPNAAQDAVTEQKEGDMAIMAPAAITADVPVVNEKVEIVDNKVDESKA